MVAGGWDLAVGVEGTGVLAVMVVMVEVVEVVVAVAREGDGPASDSIDGCFCCSSCDATFSFDWLAEDDEDGGDGSLDAPPVADGCSPGACQLVGFVLRRR